MHSEAEAELLTEIARPAHRVVELGVYEGGSAVVLVRAMGAGSELHLIDPFGEQPSALRTGWRATEHATKSVVRRAARGARSPTLIWHVGYSQDVGREWRQPIDLLFIDGDHSAEGCQRDWDLFHSSIVPGGFVAFHDARLGKPDGDGLPGPTETVDALTQPDARHPGWCLCHEVDRTVVLRREAMPGGAGPFETSG